MKLMDTNKRNTKYHNDTPFGNVMHQSGFSLVELMIGLIIGLLVTLVIMNVFSVFEGQKRTTMGGADAQTNGNIALFNITQNLQMAGYGMPILEATDSPWSCANAKDARTATVATLNLSQFSPVVIVDGGGGAPDTVTVRFGTTEFAGFPTKVVGINAADTKELTVDNNMGCKQNDVVIQAQGDTPSAMTCVLKQVQAITAGDKTHVPMNDAAELKPNGNLYCMGQWIEHRYSVNANNLEDNGVVLAPDIVNIQAQYGISAAANSNNITQWVNATGATWGSAALTAANRNRIKALRIAIVARNSLKEKTAVTSASCTTNKGTVSSGPCAWDDSSVSGSAPQIDLTGLTDWRSYRYRVYETIIPMRNIAWSRVNY